MDRTPKTKNIRNHKYIFLIDWKSEISFEELGGLNKANVLLSLINKGKELSEKGVVSIYFELKRNYTIIVNLLLII